MFVLNGSFGEFGWYAHAPTADLSPVLMVLGPRQVLGLGVMAVGLGLVGGCVGYWMALRRRS